MIPTQTNRFSEQLAANPEHLLDAVMHRLRLKTDAALSRALGVAPPLISKIRRGKLPLRYAVLVRILDITDITMRELVELSCAQTSISQETSRHDGHDERDAHRMFAGRKRTAGGSPSRENVEPSGGDKEQATT